MPEAIDVAEAVRDHCVEAALRAYEDAGISGLCAEGAGNSRFKRSVVWISMPYSALQPSLKDRPNDAG